MRGKSERSYRTAQVGAVVTPRPPQVFVAQADEGQAVALGPAPTQEDLADE